ncbi:MAG: hypothetical protein KKC30_11450 [Proteobacteria bacterium]|nr:hypothetical protein [Pseudomonadota bacterium]MBU4382432.1 hypothetical protein [Pseudomonadota bacterium]MCG2764001.1 hypothetical protein [Desulfarculaceae bacterium]
MDVINAHQDQCVLPADSYQTLSAKNVVKLRKETLLHEATTFLGSLGALTRSTIKALQETFCRLGHRPSQSMWAALVDVASTLEAMANEACPPLYYLSSLDPGVGKTQTVIHFIKVLMASQDHRGVGVLMCVSRLDEVRTILGELDLAKEMVAVFTSDKDLNALGTSHIRSARVLLTTQQMVEARTRNKPLSDVDQFHHHGRPRQVRIWDETILPGQTITLGRYDIASLLNPLTGVSPALVSDLEALFTDLRDVESGSIYPVPDFAGKHEVDLPAVLEVLQGGNHGDQAVAESLWFLSGKAASVCRDGVRGSTVLSYRETLPADLPPVLVLDASGRVRGTYPEWEAGRRNLVRLREAPKSYDNLTVNVWPIGGGKSAFRRNGNKLVDGIATTINSKPGEPWLVVHHKFIPTMVDIEKGVRELLAVDQQQVHFITWGNHHATNAFSHIPNVILAGTLFYRQSTYEALGRLSAGKPPEDGLYSEDAVARVREGENSHLILQALCRGSVRRCQGPVCAPCEAYIIASPRSGIRRELAHMFPGCHVKQWRPVPIALVGKVKEAVAFISAWFDAQPEGFLRFSSVRKALGIMDSANFKQNIRRHPDFQQAIADMGVVEDGGSTYLTGFRKLTAAWFGFEDESERCCQ